MITRIYLARHGETVWNLCGRIQGSGDSPLTPRGIEQVRQLGAHARGLALQAIYASNAPRAVRSAEIIAGLCAAPLYVDADLREMSFGPWEGLTREEIRARWPDQIENYWRAPQRYTPPEGGETFQQAQARMVAAAERIAGAHAGGAVLIVSHGAALKTLLAHHAGRPLERLWDPPPMLQASLSLIEMDAGQGRVLFEGDTSFLNLPDPAP